MTANVQDAIVLLGDSITEYGFDSNGFASKLANMYTRKLDVVNRGYSGYNTEWVIPVFEQLLVSRSEQGSEHVQKMRLLTIWYGANDAALPPSAQHVPLEKYSTNLSHLIEMVRDPSSKWYSPSTRIILITPPPLNSHQWGANSDRKFEVTRQYAQAMCEVGEKEGVPVVNVWQALYDAAGQEEKALSKYLSDGLHLTSEGYNVVYEELIKTIKVQTPELHYENLQGVFVRWGEIDYDNPRASLKKRKADL